MRRLLLLGFLGVAIALRNRYDGKFDGGPLPNLGTNYSCDPSVMGPSRSIPTNVNALRPADIKIVMALGDSLTAANGAGAEDPLAIILQYRGMAFQIGGDKTVEEHITIPNILKKFNSKLFGYSKGIGGESVWEIAQLNMAIPGAHAVGLVGQAHDLVARLKAHPEAVDMENDWKLLNIFIGGNDMCRYCDKKDYSPEKCADEIQQAIQIIHDNVPRTIVSLTSMLPLEILRDVDSGEFFCVALHTDECRCESDKN